MFNVIQLEQEEGITTEQLLYQTEEIVDARRFKRRYIKSTNTFNLSLTDTYHSSILIRNKLGETVK